MLSMVLFGLRNKITRILRPPCLTKSLQRNGSFLSWERQVTMPLLLFTRTCSSNSCTSNNSDIAVSFFVNDIARNRPYVEISDNFSRKMELLATQHNLKIAPPHASERSFTCLAPRVRSASITTVGNLFSCASDRH